MLPFNTDDISPAKAHFARDLAGSLSGVLNRFTGLEVVSHAFARHFQEQGGTIGQVGDALAAQFALTGRVEENRDTTRVVMELIDCVSARMVWHDVFEENLSGQEGGNSEYGLSGFKQHIIRKATGMVGGLAGKIVQSRNRATVDPPAEIDSRKAMALYMEAYQQVPTSGMFQRLAEALEQTLEKEPGDHTLHAMLSETLLTGYLLGFFFDAKYIERAGAHAAEAVLRDPEDQFSRYAEACHLMVTNRIDLAVNAFHDVIHMNPNDTFMTICCAYCLILTGEFDTGMGIMHSCIDLTPSLLPKHYHLPLFLVYLHRTEYEKALNEAALFNIPGFFWSPLLQAVALVHLGRLDEARDAYARVLALKPDFAYHAQSYIERVVIPEDLRKSFFTALGRVGAGYRSTCIPS